MKADGGALQVRLWSEEEFAGSKAIWDELLRRSDADPLFMSWGWQWRWWKHHRLALGAELRLVAVYSGSRLVGLAPFYAHDAVVRGVLHPRRMELIGTAWRNECAAFSDYLDIIVAREFRGSAIEPLRDWLRGVSWDELILCCIRRDGVACELAQRHLPQFARVREADPLTGWCVQLPEHFETYLEGLSTDVRRRLFNQRRKLDDPRLQDAREGDVEENLALLWRYAANRWGNAGPSEAFRGFYREVARSLAREGQLRLSRLDTRQGPLSVIFNVRAGDCVYYLQSGFDQAGSSGISPGYLHFGYAIEAACAEGARRFDFLGGTGRHRDYKRDLLTEIVPLVTYHAVRGAGARALYGAYGAWLWAKGLVRPD